MSAADDVVDRFTEAAVEWAAGGRGRPLVDAAAEALARGLDSPTLGILAAAPRATAEDEARDLAPTVFQELGISVHDRLSPEAIVEGARLRAARFLVGREPARNLARELWGMYVSAGYPDDWMPGAGSMTGT
jgi:hypothetical protein